ncbi:MAG: hypothetical protein IJJ40_06670 [Clostridia bacterium]|nr:hypothetical protein [Clostridia bacterium]
MSVLINTQFVKAAASKIDNYNNKIKTDFSKVEKSINKLNASWDGVASDNAINIFQNIKKSYCNNRFAVINNLVVFLKNKVNPDYEETETAIKNAADYFK